MEIYIYVETVLKLVVEKHALEGMDSNPLWFSVHDADLRPWFFFLVFFRGVTGF